MNVVTPMEFISVFDRIVKRRANDLEAHWHKVSEYTKLFLHREDCILRDVAKKLKLNYAEPWWTLDAILYEQADTIHFRGGGLAKHLSVAIEHENYSGRTTYQINKLSIFNAPLKVLITYPGRPGHRGVKESESLLDGCKEVLRDADVFGDFSHSRKQVIVLGSDDPHFTKLTSALLHWRYFVYEHGEFNEITNA